MCAWLSQYLPVYRYLLQIASYDLVSQWHARIHKTTRATMPIRSFVRVPDLDNSLLSNICFLCMHACLLACLHALVRAISQESSFILFYIFYIYI